MIRRRAEYDLLKAKERAHILEGLLIALDHLDEVIKLIRASVNPDEARDGLMSNFGLSELQAKAILAMRLQQLTGLERDKIKNEYDELQKTIAHLKAILASEQMQRDIIKAELNEVNTRFDDERRTAITLEDGEISMEDLINDDEVVITISHAGYIKRTKSNEYRAQNRGGRGSKGARTRDEDFIEHMFIATTHNTLLLFTESGKVHWLKVYEIPEAAKAAAGRVIQNLLDIPKEDKVRAYIVVKNLQDSEFIKNNFILFCTKLGQIKKTVLEDYSRPRQGGIAAIGIQDGDALIEAKLSNGNNQVILGARCGRTIRFDESDVRPMGRTATGVRGITLNDDDMDQVIGMVVIDPNDTEATVFAVAEKGLGKRSPLDEYPVQSRGGKGVRTILVTEKTGNLVAIKSVTDAEDLMITTSGGVIIRTQADSLRVMGRSTQGVRIIRLDDGDDIADVVVVGRQEEEEAQMEENGVENEALDTNSVENGENPPATDAENADAATDDAPTED